MDPKQALIDAITAIDHMNDDIDHPNGRPVAVDCLRSLADWLENGGFPPKIQEVLDEVTDTPEDQLDEIVGGFDGPLSSGCI